MILAEKYRSGKHLERPISSSGLHQADDDDNSIILKLSSLYNISNFFNWF